MPIALTWTELPLKNMGYMRRRCGICKMWIAPGDAYHGNTKRQAHMRCALRAAATAELEGD